MVASLNRYLFICQFDIFSLMLGFLGRGLKVVDSVWLTGVYPPPVGGGTEAPGDPATAAPPWTGHATGECLPCFQPRTSRVYCSCIVLLLAPTILFLFLVFIDWYCLCAIFSCFPVGRNYVLSFHNSQGCLVFNRASTYYSSITQAFLSPFAFSYKLSGVFGTSLWLLAIWGESLTAEVKTLWGFSELAEEVRMFTRPFVVVMSSPGNQSSKRKRGFPLYILDGFVQISWLTWCFWFF